MADQTKAPDVISIRGLAMMLDVDRDHIRAAITLCELKPVGSRAGHPVYSFVESVKALFARRGEVSPELLSPTDRKNLAMARLQELELERRRGELLPRDDVRQASAQAFALVASSIRSIPDRLEQQAGLLPEQAEQCERVIDGISEQLADDLELLHGKTG